MSKTSRRKRKAAVMELEDNSPAIRHPQLPPPVWGRVLDFMPYQEVRSALLICKMLAKEAVSYVHTLNIMRECELDIPAARRFSGSVEEVNILCLLGEFKPYQHDRFYDELGRFYYRYSLSPEVTRSSVPFLLAFPNLKRMFIGGLGPDPNDPEKEGGHDKTFYNYALCNGPEDHRVQFRALFSSLIGAYKTRALSQEVQLIGGIIEPSDKSPLLLDLSFRECSNRKGEHERCDLCRSILRHAPMENETIFERKNLCVSHEDRYKILRKRPGGDECVKRIRAKVHLGFLEKNTMYYPDLEWYEESTNDEEEKFWRKLEARGLGTRVDASPSYFSDEILQEMERRLSQDGLTPRDIPKKCFNDIYGIGDHGRCYDIWCKSTVDKLLARGYNIDPEDLLIVDETEEPALRHLKPQKNGL